MNVSELCTVEWSESQGCFHVDSYEMTLQRTTEAFLFGRESDWMFLGIFDSYKNASIFIQELRKGRPDAPNPIADFLTGRNVKTEI